MDAPGYNISLEVASFVNCSLELALFCSYDHSSLKITSMLSLSSSACCSGLSLESESRSNWGSIEISLGIPVSHGVGRFYIELKVEVNIVCACRKLAYS